MGTSASVCVGVLAALAESQVCRSPAQLARRAHVVETERLGQQSGIQDQWAAAAGGINLITMDAYPPGHARGDRVAARHGRGAEAQLLVVLLTRGHDSSAVHDLVVASWPTRADDPRLEALRRCARDGAEALQAGDCAGAVLTRNTEAQAALHPSLVNHEAHAIIAAVTGPDTLGVKVNGAGGAGGSLTVLAAAPRGTRTARGSAGGELPRRASAGGDTGVGLKGSGALGSTSRAQGSRLRAEASPKPPALVTMGRSG